MEILVVAENPEAVVVVANPEPVERQTIASKAILRKFFFKVGSSRVWHLRFSSTDPYP
jgi:hypothetical protein